MTFFESLVALLMVAIALLQVSRRLSLPYPAMLAAAGVIIAFVPGVPSIRLEPDTALALFIAPVLVDAAFDFPVSAARRLWRPLFALAVVAVLLTAGVVTGVGVLVGGMPIVAAFALGAIVAPPDAAAATAVLSAVSMPRRSVIVLKGESLLNDALALLLFTAALRISEQGSFDAGIALQLGLAAPGGILLGIAWAVVLERLTPHVSGTLGGNLMEFANTFAVWLVAEHLGLSAVLTLVAFGMTIARRAGLRQSPRMRVHSFAVWSSVVFLLNVLAFMLMGMQLRSIVASMPWDRLTEAATFAAIVVAAVIATRIAWVLLYNFATHAFPALRGDEHPPTLAQGLLVGWSGMRGLLSLAAALALPGDFPERDVILLTAFAVVLATLVVQGFTLAPLVRLLRLDGDDGFAEELASARGKLAEAALDFLGDRQGSDAAHLRYGYELARDAAREERQDEVAAKRALGLEAMHRQRKRLEKLRADDEIGPDAYLALQEELDFRQVGMTDEDERRIEEN